MGRQNLTLRAHQQVHVLQYVQEKLVAPVLDALATPANLAGNLRGYLHLLLLGGRLDALLCDEGLQGAGVRVLRVAKVEDLIQQLVDEHEVILDVLLRDLAEVGLHHLDDLQKELKHHRGVHILLGHSRQPNVCSL